MAAVRVCVISPLDASPMTNESVTLYKIKLKTLTNQPRPQSMPVAWSPRLSAVQAGLKLVTRLKCFSSCPRETRGEERRGEERRGERGIVSVEGLPEVTIPAVYSILIPYSADADTKAHVG